MTNYLTKGDMKKIAELDKKRQEEKKQKEIEKAAKELNSKRPPNYSYDNIKVSKSEMSNLIASARKWAKNDPPKDDMDVLVRIEKFWDTCEETGEIPTWTNFAMCLGVEYRTVDDWEKGKGCSRERAKMIADVRNMFRTIQDTLALTGKTAALPYIWQSKQFLGYREPSTKLEVTQTTPLDALPDIAEVESKYLANLPKEAFLDAPEDIGK